MFKSKELRGLSPQERFEVIRKQSYSDYFKNNSDNTNYMEAYEMISSTYEMLSQTNPTNREFRDKYNKFIPFATAVSLALGALVGGAITQIISNDPLTGLSIGAVAGAGITANAGIIGSITPISNKIYNAVCQHINDKKAIASGEFLAAKDIIKLHQPTISEDGFSPYYVEFCNGDNCSCMGDEEE